MADDADPSMAGGAVLDEGVTETRMSPMGACRAPLNDGCDLCLQEKRQCDGGGLGPCSSCVSERRAVCHYSESTLPDQEPPRRRSSRNRGAPAGRSHGRARDAGVETSDSHRRRQLGGGGSAAGAGGSGEIASSQVALKRSRLSASPATGLIGLPENGFLDDFFGSLGFMPLASECVVRDAMVSVMFAEALSSDPLLLPPSTRGAGEDDDDATDANGQAEGGHWCKAVVGEGSALPRNSSTCLLWCAIALGALVRGSPLAHVRRYVDLAEDSLDACSGSATVEIVRAHIAMALLHNFLGDKEKNHDHLRLANSAMDAVPAEEVPKDLLELRDYAGMAWNSEGAPTSAGRVSLTNFCSDNASFRKLPDVFGEEDVRSFFIGVDSRSRTSLLLAAEVSIFQLCPSRAAARSAEKRRKEASKERSGGGESDGGGGGGGGGGGEGGGSDGGSSGASGAEAFPPDRAPPEMHPDMLPEMLRLKAYVNSSAMRSGVGALMFYRILATLQTMNNDPAGTIDSFWRSLDVKVRYPGLCRLNDWLHTTHAQLWSLASGPYRERYEELRSAYNPVRPEGSPAAPPYDRWSGMSDICDNPDAFCRGLTSPESFRLTADRHR